MPDLPDLSHRVCLITGATNGIGTETARVLAGQGATVVLVARNRERGEATLRELRAHSGHDRVHVLVADLASQRQIRALAEAFTDQFDRLHVLINNAGVMMGKRVLTEDGLETTLAVNHLAPFLLTHLLLPVLKGSAPSRIINVASNAHRWGALRFDNLQGERWYNEWVAYGYSKLENLYFTYELAGRLRGTGVTVNAVHPGAVNTGIGRAGSWLLRVFSKVTVPFRLSAAQGARTSVYLAASPEVAGVTGRYFITRKARKTSRASYDEGARKRVWDLSERLTGLNGRQPG